MTNSLLLDPVECFLVTMMFLDDPPGGITVTFYPLGQHGVAYIDT